jgi:serine/threonine protein kinase/tetratricopeptide (TPR) repeat protein
MSQPANQAEAIVDALLGMSREERAAYMAQACGGDAQQRLLVEGMLKAHEQAEALIQMRGFQNRKTIAVASLPISEKPGDRIGRYKLLQQIGEGGCGVVYLAEQSEPVRRRVALKVIKPGMDTRQVIARFEAERQALAMMDHPNIAKVFDGGVTETGRPFFVMELVKGLPITRYCDEHKLDTAQRLELFVQVCEAIQHAHQKEIIHRDIKPSNILVSERDGTAVPKVIDFGIAKAISGQSLTEKTLFTAFDQFIGTPTYMSPEQAELTVLEIDHRSDVYSLGVLLYELLTGRTPFDPKRLGQAAIEEVRRIIREEDPIKPSTRLSVLEQAERTTVARARQCEPPKLIGLILGDLDWIVMKTLEKDRTRRYETPNGLGADIRRFLRNEPIMARPPSRFYRIGKMVRRHKLAFRATTAVVAGFILAGGVLTYALRLPRRGETTAPPESDPKLGGTTNEQALERYVRGIADLVNTRDVSRLKVAANWFQGAIHLDTNFALAWVSLANACRQLDLGFEPGQGWDKKAFEAAQKAISLNPRLPDAFVFRGALYFTPYGGWNAEADVQDQRTALLLNPKVKKAHYNLAFVYNHLGLLDETLTEVKKELKNTPGDSAPRMLTGATLVAQGHYKNGLQELELSPPEAYPHPRIAGYLKGIALFYLGKTNEADVLLKSMLATQELTNDALLVSVQAILCAAAGKQAEAEAKIEIAKQCENRFIHFHHIAYDIGSAYALMHRYDDALTWLQRAADEGDPCYPFLEKDPNLDNLRANPAFKTFLDIQRKDYERIRAKFLLRGKADR